MLNQNGKNHFTQVAMIESQYESKRKNMLPNSSLLSNKSPLRERQYDRQNYNNINTPTRLPANRAQLSSNSSMMSNAVNKISLSPLRSRRNNNNEASLASIKSTVSRRKFTEPVCDQHKNKQAQFILESEGECFYFCQTCAIPLIAQGFPCMKIQSKNGYSEEENPRIKQINQFLKSIDTLTATLNQKKSCLSEVYAQHSKILATQRQKITEYYQQMHEIINQHMSRVIEQMETEYRKSTKDLQNEENSLSESLKTMKQMKDDITSSINSVIIEASDSEYRSVMNEYYGNLDGCKKHKNSNYEDLIQENKVRRLVFGDCEPILQGITRLLGQELIVEWDDELEQGEETQQNPKPAMINLNNMKMRKVSDAQSNQLESQRENPIECLQTEERNKSNLKQLGGLFCSFDD